MEAGKKYSTSGLGRYAKGEYECLFVAKESALVRYQLTNDSAELLIRREYFPQFKEIKPKKVIEGWLNIYPIEGKFSGLTPVCTFYKTKQAADEGAACYRIDCIPFRHEYEEN